MSLVDVDTFIIDHYPNGILKELRGKK